MCSDTAGDNRHWLEPLFLGAYAENNDLFERLLLEHLRDHFYWRRNFHPGDRPPIDTTACDDPQFRETEANTREALHELSARLKQSIPFFHPRYVGHMSSDLLLPGVLAQMITMLYNPNNVCTESASVTIDMELEVGRNFAKMVGFDTDESHYPCAWGHLTSGGTVANIEALWNIRSARFIGFAVAKACAELGLEMTSESHPGQSLAALNDWQLFNLPLDESLQLWHHYLKAAQDPQDLALRQVELNKYRPDNIGIASFFQQFWTIKPPLLVVPATAHYSWKKAAQILGLGSDQLVSIPVDRHMRMDADSLQRVLEKAAAMQTPILAVVGVLGTTEFGTIDPIHRIVELQQRMQKQGLYFAIHVDAAWGGFLCSILRDETYQARPRDEVARKFKHFPSQSIYDALLATANADSVTLDPHKLGYSPFGVGGVVYRNRLISELQMQHASYVFGSAHAESAFHNLGQFILEGSKSGAAAAGVYVSHKVLPLHSTGMGRLVSKGIYNVEYFFDQFETLQNQLQDIIRLTIPVEPDSHLITIATNPVGNHSMKVCNQFTQQLESLLRFDQNVPVQTAEYLGSSTRIQRDKLTTAEVARLCLELGIDSDSFVEHISAPERQDSSLLVLRHTLMNPWLTHNQNGLNFIDDYFAFLARHIRALLDKQDRGPGADRGGDDPGTPQSRLQPIGKHANLRRGNTG